MRHLLCLLAGGLIWLPAQPARASEAEPRVSVGIFYGQQHSAYTITADGPLALEDPRGRRAAEFPGGSVLRAEADEGRVKLTCAKPFGSGHGERYVVSSPAPIQVTPEGGTARAYRGGIVLSVRRGRLEIANRIGLEDYLRGVLPAEVPPSFAPEALRAQVIAARTYALVTVGQHTAEGFDICDQSHCQVYLGLAGEDARTDAAVRDTSGLVVTYEGKLIQAVYHDTCGGRTAGSETAWRGSTSLPYLRPVSDCEGQTPRCGRSPRAVWTRQIPQARLAAALAPFHINAPIAAIDIGDRDENGRPREYVVRGAHGNAVIPAGELRAAVNRVLGRDTLLSADFTAAPNGDAIVFAGRGSGHGVGLCQWGADAMARAGSSAAEILAHYYSGAAVQPLSPEILQRSRPRAGM